MTSASIEQLWGTVLARVEVELRPPLEVLLARERVASLALGSLQLTPYEEPEYVGQDLAMWEEVATPLRSVLMGLHDVRDALAQLRPAESNRQDDVDIAFDLIDPTPAEPIRDRMSYDVDDLLQQSQQSDTSSEAMIRQALLPLGEMMRFELTRFGNRFRNPTVIADRWNLLSELQEFKGKFAKLLTAVRLAAILPHTTPDERERLVDYRTELDNSLVVRRALAFLMRDVLALVEATADISPEERRFLLEELFMRLLRFSRHSAYALLRAPDKRQVIEFRKALAGSLGADDAATARRTREQLEGFVRFLEAMQSINKREVLVAHDGGVAFALRAGARHLEGLLVEDPGAALPAFAEWREQASTLLGLLAPLDDFLLARPLVDELDDLRGVLPFMARLLARLPGEE